MLRKTQNSVELKHDFNIWSRSVQHMYYKKKKNDKDGALWVRIPSTKPASAHYRESYRVLEIYYKLPVLKIKLQLNLV